MSKEQRFTKALEDHGFKRLNVDRIIDENYELYEKEGKLCILKGFEDEAKLFILTTEVTVEEAKCFLK